MSVKCENVSFPQPFHTKPFQWKWINFDFWYENPFDWKFIENQCFSYWGILCKKFKSDMRIKFLTFNSIELHRSFRLCYVLNRCIIVLWQGDTPWNVENIEIHINTIRSYRHWKLRKVNVLYRQPQIWMFPIVK